MSFQRWSQSPQQQLMIKRASEQTRLWAPSGQKRRPRIQWPWDTGVTRLPFSEGPSGVLVAWFYPNSARNLQTHDDVLWPLCVGSQRCDMGLVPRTLRQSTRRLLFTWRHLSFQSQSEILRDADESTRCLECQRRMGGKKEKARHLGSSYRSYPVIKTDTHTCGTD
jgi:hypothetical protein